MKVSVPTSVRAAEKVTPVVGAAPKMVAAVAEFGTTPVLQLLPVSQSLELPPVQVCALADPASRHSKKNTRRTPQARRLPDPVSCPLPPVARLTGRLQIRWRDPLRIV